MRRHAHQLRRAGRFGDTELVHINRRELAYLTAIWGEPSTNPTTGLPEFFDLGGALSWIAPVALPALTEAIGGAGTLGEIGSWLGAGSDWAPTVGGGLVGAVTGGLTQGLQGKDWLTGTLGGGALGALVPSAGKALGFNGFQTPFNIPTLFDVGSLFGAAGSSPVASAAAGAASAGWDPTQAAGPNNVPVDTVAKPAKEGFLARNPMVLLGALGALAGLASSPAKASPATASPTTATKSTSYTFPTNRLNRTRNTTNVGQPGEYRFFNDNQTPDVPLSYARGGALMGAPMASSGAHGRIAGPGDGRADLIDARLSNKEYVMDAETMAMLGNGDPDAGADKLDDLRVKLRKHKGRALAKGRFSPDAKPVEGYL